MTRAEPDAADSAATPDQEPVAASYLAAVHELDDLLHALESDEADVDALAASVARAAELIAFCRTRIRAAEERVNEIVVDLDELGADPAGADPVEVEAT